MLVFVALWLYVCFLCALPSVCTQCVPVCVRACADLGACTSVRATVYPCAHRCGLCGLLLSSLTFQEWRGGRQIPEMTLQI